MEHPINSLSTLTDKGDEILIHNFGDEAIAVDFPHGNTSRSQSVHVRTCPSVMKNQTETCTHDTAAIVYRNYVADIPSSTLSHIAVLYTAKGHKASQEHQIPAAKDAKIGA